MTASICNKDIKRKSTLDQTRVIVLVTEVAEEVVVVENEEEAEVEAEEAITEVAGEDSMVPNNLSMHLDRAKINQNLILLTMTIMMSMDRNTMTSMDKNSTMIPTIVSSSSLNLSTRQKPNSTNLNKNLLKIIAKLQILKKKKKKLLISLRLQFLSSLQSSDPPLLTNLSNNNSSKIR